MVLVLFLVVVNHHLMLGLKFLCELHIEFYSVFQLFQHSFAQKG